MICKHCEENMVEMTTEKSKRKSFSCISLGCDGLGKVFLGGINIGNRNPRKLIVDQLIKDLEYRPEDFDCNSNEIVDNKTNVRYSLDIYYAPIGVKSPYKLKFGIIQGYRFLRAVKKWKAVSIINSCLGLKPGGAK